MRTCKKKCTRPIIIPPTYLLLSLAFLLLSPIKSTKDSQINEDDQSNRSHQDNSPLIDDKSPQHDHELQSGEQECNTTLLTMFGVSGDKRPKDDHATTTEKSFCRRNRRSCCSAFNIQSTNLSFAKGAKALKTKFEIVEELFSLFRGPLFLNYVTEHKGKDECHEPVKDLKMEIDNKTYGFFDMVYHRYQMMMVENLLMDVQLYVKKNLWFYGDLICTACNPNLQSHFILDQKGSSFEVHTNTCSEMMEEREFERNLLLLYNNFLHKTMQFVECVEDIKDREEDPEAEEDEEEISFVKLEEAQVSEFLDNFDNCWDDQKVSQPQCVTFCTKSLRLYKFPIDHLMHNYKVSLEIMYKAMTGNEISEYYEVIKDYEWKIDRENDAIAFYPQNELWSEYKFDELKWTFHTTKGQNIYKELMSKKYLEAETISLWGRAVVGALLALILIK